MALPLPTISFQALKSLSTTMVVVGVCFHLFSSAGQQTQMPSDPAIRKHLGVDADAEDWVALKAIRAAKDNF
eukprot:scaffold269_cov17-Tisochrysis_lutea.AAC.4